MAGSVGGTVIVTGANAGVGFEACRLLAQDGLRVVLVCRSEDRGRAALEAIRSVARGPEPVLVRCDLGSLDEVRSAARGLATVAPRPLALVNNAGLYRARREHTVDGFERTLAVNHLGHLLLTRLLEEPLRAARARVVNVTSRAHRKARLHRRPLDDILRGRGRYRGFQAYADSKLANLLFTRELARRWSPDVEAVAVHPGLLATSIWDRNRTLSMWIVGRLKRFMGDPARGGEAVAAVATDPRLSAHPGAYVNRTRVEEPELPDEADALAGELWRVSATAVGLRD